MEKSKIPALSRAIEIMNYISRTGECGAQEIVQALDIPKSSVYLILDELVSQQFIHRKNNGQYILWLKLVDLSSKALKQMDIRKTAEPYLAELMMRTGLVCHLGILDRGFAHYILKIESHNTIKVPSYEGKALSLVRSAIGKCLLAFQEDDQIASIMAELDFSPRTATSITSKEALLKDLAKIRQDGWSFDNGEDVEGIRCFAAPILNINKQLVAAISVVGTAHQIADSAEQDLSRLVMQYAGLISQEQLGTG